MHHLGVSFSPTITLSSSQPVPPPKSWDFQRDVLVKQSLLGSAETWIARREVAICNLTLFENNLWTSLKPDVFSFYAEQKLLSKGSCSVTLIFLKIRDGWEICFYPATPYNIQNNTGFSFIEIIQHWNFPTASTLSWFLVIEKQLANENKVSFPDPPPPPPRSVHIM